MRLSVGNLLRATVGFVLLLLLALVSFPASAAALDEPLRDGEAVTVAGFNYDDALTVSLRSGEAAARASAPGTDRSEDWRADHRDLVGNYDPSAERVAPSGLLDDFADVGSGASLIRRVDVDGVPVSIKSGHGYRPDHGSVDITGVLGRDAVDSAVATDLATRVSAGTSVTRAGSGHSTFQTVVGGHTVEYRAVFVPATGRYEVGTYYIP